MSNIKLTFEPYLNKISKSKKVLLNTIKLSQNLQFFANPKQKIIEKNKVKKV